jgi:hypothetical protein
VDDNLVTARKRQNAEAGCKALPATKNVCCSIVQGLGTNDHPARGFYLMDEDRVDLKRFADRLRP